MATSQKTQRDTIESLRYLLLPIEIERESNVLIEINALLDTISVEHFERANFIKLQYDIWKSEGRLNDYLKAIISTVLFNGNEENGLLLSEKYFDIHERLRQIFYFSFEEATIILSYLNLIIYFANEEKMSSAKIAQMLLANDSRLKKISWRAIQDILQNLKLKPILVKEKVERIYEIDIIFEEIYFVDSDINQASHMVGRVATDLGFSKDLESLLIKLTSNMEIFFPYIQILHYQSIIGEFYNHILSNLYEFSPRGTIANYIFDKYKYLVSTGNPILNNAKAVDTLDINWARSKDLNIEQAYALAEILQAFAEVGYATSRELTSWVRCWILRVIRLQNPIKIKLSPLNEMQVNKLLTFLSTHESETYGILEQRIIDALTSFSYREIDGWRSRGLGDSVNTNNISRKKLGDCDYQNAANYQIHGFEAHGGKLTKTYFDEHKRSFIRSLIKRSDELEGITDLSNWQIRIEYIAHSYSIPQENINYNNLLEIEIVFTLYRDYISKFYPITQELIEYVNIYLTSAINSSRTPNYVREKVINIIA